MICPPCLSDIWCGMGELTLSTSYGWDAGVMTYSRFQRPSQLKRRWRCYTTAQLQHPQSQLQWPDLSLLNPSLHSQWHPMNGKRECATDHAAPAALSVRAELFARTTLLPPRLLKLQPNGVQATRASHMTTRFLATRKGVGNARTVMSGKQKLWTGPCITLVAPIVNTSRKRTGKSSGTQC